MVRYILIGFFTLLISTFAIGQGHANFDNKEVIYGHKYGMATTMIVATPIQSNGKGIISVVSGNWVSSYKKHQAQLEASKPYLDAGYTVFLTMHSSAPIFDITEAVSDIKRAVQFVRYNAEKFSIDPDNIGITGGSSGGHVALTVANADDIQNLDAEDPIERVSSKVQAVAVFYPPTDFLNFGMEGFNPVTYKHLLVKQGVLGAFQFKTFNEESFLFEVIEDADQILDIARSVSPAQLVSPDDPPTFIIHGDKDIVVPLQQSQLIVSKLEQENVPVVLSVKEGGEHGWDNMYLERVEFVKWFDKYLVNKASASSSQVGK
jgi:acetyl esterase/lipase